LLEVFVAQLSAPLALWCGVALFIVAALADLGHHLLPHALSHTLDPVVGPHASTAHILIVLAMAIVLVGLVQHGIQRAIERDMHQGAWAEAAATREAPTCDC
jgi:hypothetical protein